jgi:N-acetylglucosaminyldiphosphoundecaprenol N-acetyl-beta-D-mannosaminyltransferase
MKTQPNLGSKQRPSVEIPVSEVFGYPVFAATLGDFCQFLKGRARARAGGWYVTLNLEMIARGEKRGEYRELLKRADGYTADGMPVVWNSRTRGSVPIPERVTGVDVVESLLQDPEIRRVALVGGMGSELLRHSRPFDELFITGGKIEPNEIWCARLAAEIELRGIEVVLVALGVPKQDLVSDYLRKFGVRAVILGVGSSVDVFLGMKSRAPRWVQKIGLEWFFRLLSEPLRLWKRYLLLYPWAVLALIRERFQK